VDESPLAGLHREALEEAGLDLAWAKQVHIGPTLKIDREVEQGWQRESLHVVDAELPADFAPTNWDGEVQGFQQLDEASALRLALSGQMTADAAMVTLDFLRRRR
jgi:8-oxo-dGTP pyrophosphatase MutT (NUDIX family)